MAKFTDGTRYADLYAGYYIEGGVSCDISTCILDALSLCHTADGFFIVDDMEAALLRLDLWCNGWGPFHADEDTDPYFYYRTIAVEHIKGYGTSPAHVNT